MDYFINNVFNYPTLAECYKVAALNGSNKLRLLWHGDDEDIIREDDRDLKASPDAPLKLAA